MYRRVKDFYLNEIERYIQFLKKLTPSQVEQLKGEQARIRFIFDGLGEDKPIVVTPKNKEHASMLLSIEQMRSKQEVESYLQSMHLKRTDLEALCKLKDIPFTKRDNMTILKDKIFERLVGFKIRSRAIQNDEL